MILIVFTVQEETNTSVQPLNSRFSLETHGELSLIASLTHPKTLQTRHKQNKTHINSLALPFHHSKKSATQELEINQNFTEVDVKSTLALQDVLIPCC